MKKLSKVVVLLVVFQSSCARDSPPVKVEVVPIVHARDVLELRGGFSQTKARGLCSIYQSAVFSGEYVVERIVTNMVTAPNGVQVPQSTITFELETGFDQSAQKSYVYVTNGGTFPNGDVISSDVTVRVGENYVIFPSDVDGRIVLSPDSIFRKNSSGMFSNEHLLNRTQDFDSAAFESHYRGYQNYGCKSEIVPDVWVIDPAPSGNKKRTETVEVMSE